LVAGRVTVGGDPTNDLPASWQVEQAVALTTECTMPGGAVVLALANENVEKLVAVWQAVQFAPAGSGTWLLGSVFTAGVPTKLRPAP
jgi:hypothetical protein